MTLDEFPLVIGLLLVALLIVVINDRTKPKLAPKNPAKRAPGSTLGLLIGIVVVAGVIGLGSGFGRDVPSLKWLVPLVFVSTVLFALLFVLRRVIWVYLKSAVTGQLPRVIKRKRDGRLEMKCPRCSGLIPVTPGRIGETAFECPHCGEKATWASDKKS